jgi:hypothetical protein
MLDDVEAPAANSPGAGAEFTRLAQDLQRLAGETVLPLQRELYLRAAARFSELSANGYRHALAEIRSSDGSEDG